MWQPLMWPTEYTAAKIAKANENEIVDSSALPNGFLPVRSTVNGTEPAPMKTRMAVPIASAVSFWVSVGDDDIDWTSFGSGMDDCAVRAGRRQGRPTTGRPPHRAPPGAPPGRPRRRGRRPLR